jgi:uncharacterized lipoprotein YddW (UPF0748 family)
MPVFQGILQSRRLARTSGLAVAVSLLGGILFGTLTAAPATPADTEARALWVRSTSLSSPAAVAAMVKSARSGHFNTLLVQVRARGDAYFTSSLEPRAASLSAQPDSFDPLALTLKLAHDQGIRVHAWIDIGLVSSAVQLPAARTHVVYRHPEWLMVPRALARDMLLLDANSQLYLDKLTRWTRAQSGDVEGLYLSPVPEAAANATVAVVADLAARYPIDGVHLDYIRYPDDEFDYSRLALEAFRAEMLSGLDPETGQQKDRATGQDLVAWPEAYPDQWRQFRRNRLTNLVTRIRESVKARRPDIIVSAAVVPDPDDALSRRLQDWAGWVRQGLLDVVCPMAYATDRAGFAAQVTQATQGAGSRPVWAGIGAYRLSSSDTIENIRIARRLGAAGIILFSYDALASLPRGLDYLAQVSRAAFTR